MSIKTITHPKEFVLKVLRDCPRLAPADWTEPANVGRYWDESIATAPNFDAGVEWFAVLLFDTRNHLAGHVITGQGTSESVSIDERSVFRAAVVASSKSVVLTHNHPSGDPTPSDADIALTNRFVRAGSLLGIQVTDHVIIGEKEVCSMRKAGMIDSSGWAVRTYRSTTRQRLAFSKWIALQELARGERKIQAVPQSQLHFSGFGGDGL